VAVDYPDFGEAVGRAVADGQADLGLCVCGTGNGMAMAANKVPGVRAALVHDVTTAALARRHGHANVVCLGARITGATVAVEALAAFLAAPEEHGRHDIRIEKLAGLDRDPVHHTPVEGTP
jgi:ribose 5-phosphate isomerase B